MAGATPETFPAIGRLGFPVFVAVRQGPFKQLVPYIKAYREAYKAAGHPGEGQVYLRVPGLSRRHRGARPRRTKDSLMSFFAYQAELGRDSARRAGGEVAVAAAEAGRAPGGADL